MPDVPVDADCIFCKIVAGTIPCARVYEDEHVVSFLDIGPVSRGHTLVIPKGHWVTLDAVPAEAAAACGRVLPRLSAAVMKATGAASWNVLQNNGKAAHQAVGHVHFHIIPKTPDAGLGLDWPVGKLDPDDANDLAAKITRGLK